MVSWLTARPTVEGILTTLPTWSILGADISSLSRSRLRMYMLSCLDLSLSLILLTCCRGDIKEENPVLDNEPNGLASLGKLSRINLFSYLRVAPGHVVDCDETAIGSVIRAARIAGAELTDLLVARVELVPGDDALGASFTLYEDTAALTYKPPLRGADA